jgi:hypothetical protein
MSLLEPPTCARDMMDYTDWSETNSVWKSGPGICSCSLMPEGTGSRFYTGMAPAFGAAPRETLHNARKGYLRVLYPYHPYYGQTLEVFGAGGGLRDLVYVRMPNNTTRGIPAWMFDESICASVRCADRAIIDFQALIRLAQLLDLELQSRGIERHESSVPRSRTACKISSWSVNTGAGKVPSKRSNAKRRSK